MAPDAPGPRLMARKLKTYQTSIGFYDLAVAAPSMKAALQIWGADSNLFHQGFAREVEDAEVVAATLEHPGTVLRRPVGTDGSFRVRATCQRIWLKGLLGQGSERSRRGGLKAKRLSPMGPRRARRRQRSTSSSGSANTRSAERT
jgi:colicin import membrane protein